MKRRDFLRRTAMTGAGMLGLGGLTASDLAAQTASAATVVLVHTNDIHSHLDPLDSGGWAGLGGAAKRAAMVADLRKRYPNLLLLDAGDVFMGTPYFTMFEGEPEMRAMSASGYVASTIGNHEFDAGIDRLAEVTREYMEFPWLCANYDFSDTPMAGLTRESMVIDQDGLRIGLLGLGISLDGLVAEDSHGGTRYLDPMSNARRVARHLRNEEGCHFVVALSHVSIRGRGDEPGDMDLAAHVPEIDVVIGGHNHTLLEQPERVERRVAAWEQGVAPTGWVNQVGAYGTHLGVMAFHVYGAGQVESAGANAMAAE